MDTLRSLVNGKRSSNEPIKTTPQPTTTMPPTTPPNQISLSGLNITSPSATQEQLRDLTERLQLIEDALEYPLHDNASFDARLVKLENTIAGLTQGIEREEGRNQKLDNALPKIANAVGRIHDHVEVLKREVERLKEALRGENRKTWDEGSKEGEKDAKREEDEEGDSFASASEVATDKGMKKEEKLKHMDHGGRADRVVRTVFEEIDYGHEVEYKKISQELRKDGVV